MELNVRLTERQAVQVCELVGTVERANFRTLSELGLNGHDIRTLRNAAVRILVPLIEGTNDAPPCALRGQMFKQLEKSWTLHKRQSV